MSSPNDRYRKYGGAASFRKRRGVAECPIAAIPAIAATRIERGGDAKSSILRPIGPGGSAEESNMRAAFITGYGDNSVVGCGEIADPTPGADEALIEVRAAGTNPVEISMREGHFKATLPFSFPQVMGYDIAGVVASAPTGSVHRLLEVSHADRLQWSHDPGVSKRQFGPA